MRIPALVLALLSCLLFSDSQAVESKPNIIIIYTDDMGYGDISCNGGKIAKTPNIDRLASEGIRFTQFYVASPICSPSRAGLLTGSYPARWRLRTFLQSKAGNKAAGQVDFLDPKAPTMPRIFQNAGYATAHIGKWHLGGGRDVKNAPPFSAYGYHEHSSTYESPSPDPNITATDWIWSAQDKVKRWERTAYFVDKTLDFLRRKKEQPCFINFWPDDVHNPWVPKDPAGAKGGKGAHKSEAEFRAVLEEYDKQIGRLLDGIKALGIEHNTIVIFTSDNGPGPDFPGNPRSLGMRGQKATLFEGGIRMPFLIRWPAHTPSNKVDKTTVLGSVDLLPSLCALAGVQIPKDISMDGEDLSKALTGEPATRSKPLFWIYGRNRGDEDKDGKRDLSPPLGVRDGQWKLLVNSNGSQVHLYDLKADPKEKKNVANEHKDVAKHLKAEVLKWHDSLPKSAN